MEIPGAEIPGAETPGAETPAQAAPAPVPAAGPRYVGVAHDGAGTGIIVAGARDPDGDAVTYRMAPSDPASNDNGLVTLALVDGQLTIVFISDGPDFESVRGEGQTARRDGTYVFVVEAVSNSDLGDDATDRSSRAGERTATQTYHFTVTDSDEAPWNIDITSRGIGNDGTVGDLTASNDAGETTIFAVKDGGVMLLRGDGGRVAVLSAILPDGTTQLPVAELFSVTPGTGTPGTGTPVTYGLTFNDRVAG